MKSKYNVFSKNIILFSISSFGHKILAFLLIPLYTSFLSTGEYGTIDLVTTTVSLLIPIFTLNISDAVMRFTLSDKENGSYFGLGLRVTMKGSLMLAVFLTTATMFPFLAEYKPYMIWVFVIYMANALYNLLQNFLRATDRVPVMVTASLINSFVMLSLNVVLIAWLRLGINGYYIAMLAGLSLSTVFMAVRSKAHRHMRMSKKEADKVRTDCMKYCIPTIFTTLSWWINSGLDRFFVSAYCGIDQNGIYSIAYKIPTILGIFHNIFAQAWTLSAIVEFDKDDTDGFFGKTYSMYNSMMVLVTSGIIILNILLSKLLYANDFFAAWRYVPVLLLSSLFSALSGYFGSIFAAVKDTKTCAFSTMVSAGVNIVLNAVLIPPMGVMGAALATAVAYVVAWGMRIVIVRRYIHIKNIFTRDVLAYMMLVVQVAVSITDGHLYWLQTILFAVIALLYCTNYWKVCAGVGVRIKKLSGGRKSDSDRL